MIKTIKDETGKEIQVARIGDEWCVLDPDEDRLFIIEEEHTERYVALKSITGLRGVSWNGSRVIQYYRELFKHKEQYFTFFKNHWWIRGKDFIEHTRFSKSTFRRTMTALRARRIIIADTPGGMNRTVWFRLDEDHLKNLLSMN